MSKNTNLIHEFADTDGDKVTITDMSDRPWAKEHGPFARIFTPAEGVDVTPAAALEIADSLRAWAGADDDSTLREERDAALVRAVSAEEDRASTGERLLDVERQLKDSKAAARIASGSADRLRDRLRVRNSQAEAAASREKTLKERNDDLVANVKRLERELAEAQDSLDAAKRAHELFRPVTSRVSMWDTPTRLVIELADMKPTAPSHIATRAFINGQEVRVHQDGIRITHTPQGAVVANLALLPDELHLTKRDDA